MSDFLLGLLTGYGAALLALATFLSCLALPIPSSLMMLGGGAFTVSGDLGLASVALSAWGGAVAGDQLGFGIGAKGGGRLVRWMERHRNRRATVRRARQTLRRWGGPSVFLTRWLFSPLGPYVNFIAGAGRLRWGVFTLGSVAGEAVWVAIYVGLGRLFADRIELVADYTGTITGLLAALVLSGGLGWLAWHQMAQHRRNARRRDAGGAEEAGEGWAAH